MEIGYKNVVVSMKRDYHNQIDSAWKYSHSASVTNFSRNCINVSISVKTLSIAGAIIPSSSETDFSSALKFNKIIFF